MSQALENKVEKAIVSINELHDTIAKVNWATLKRDGFVFELEHSDKRLKDIYLALNEINKELKLLLEKNTPTLDSILSELSREMTIIESNIIMEKKKKLRQEMVNALESVDVPDLYSSLQQKILSLSLKLRYNIDRIKNFLSARKMPFVKKGSTAKHLLDALSMKEQELNELKQKSLELKRKSYFGNVTEKTIADIESELHEMDKKLNETVTETSKSLKTHFAQINYVEGSFIDLKKRVEEIDATHSQFSKKALEVIRELKKERDFAKTLALEMEHETHSRRNEYTKQILSIEEKKNAIEERLAEKHDKETEHIKRQLEEKSAALKHAHKLIEKLENEVKELKSQKA